MQNISKLVNQPVKLGKRVLSGLIDVLIVILFSYCLMSFVATPIANSNFGYEEKVDLYDVKVEEYYKIAVDYELGSFDEDGKFVEIEDVKEHENYDIFVEETKTLADEINKLAGDVNVIANSIFLITTFVSETIFWLIVPLFEKKRRSIGMIITKLSIIHRDELPVSTKQIIYRFLSLYLIETLIFYFLFGSSIAYMGPLVGFIIMYASIYRNGLHDMMAKTRVVEGEPILFSSVEERNNYVFDTLKVNKEAIDVEVNEVIEDELTLIDAQYKEISTNEKGEKYE